MFPNQIDVVKLERNGLYRGYVFSQFHIVFQAQI